MDELNKILVKAQSLNDDRKYQEVIDLLTDELLEKYNNSNLYSEKAQALYRLDAFQLSKKSALKSISLNPDDIKGNNYLGNIYLDDNNLDDALKCFTKLAQIDPENIYAYFGIGRVYSEQNKYSEAIQNYEKVLKIDTKFLPAYNRIGIDYKDSNDYDNAIKYFTLGLEINNKYDAFVYNRALTYNLKEDHKNALSDYERYIELTKDSPDFFTKRAKSSINELKKLIKSAEYSSIRELVNKIKVLLRFNDGCVTHYTSLTVAKALILDEKSLLRLSEGSFLNDTSEGRELFNFLNFHHSIQKKLETLAEKFSQKPFIGSFVAEVKHDDLTLWRMYGKEQKEEAKGCALTIDMNKLVNDLNEKLIPTNDNQNSSSKLAEEFCFYRVAYRKPDSGQQFLIPDTEPRIQSDLNSLMNELQEKIVQFKKKRKSLEEKQNLIELLNEISYLFKSDEYQFENEVRLVVKGIGFDKIIKEEDQKPKVYIELVSIRPLVRKITLGPKVDRADEWAAAFFYNLDKDNFNPEILISHLPFK